MTTKEILETVKNAALSVKHQKQEVISVDALIAYLDALKTHTDVAEEINKRKFESDLETFRANHEKYLAHYEAQQSVALEAYRSVIIYGGATLRSAMLINGGAAAALLAFIGNIWTKGIEQAAVGSLTKSISFFAFGVLIAAVGTAGSYFTQYCYSERFGRTAVVFHTLTVVFILISFILFGFGAYESYAAFVTHLARAKTLAPMP